jgi:hypothetical protein
MQMSVQCEAKPDSSNASVESARPKERSEHVTEGKNDETDGEMQARSWDCVKCEGIWGIVCSGGR